MSDGDPAPSTIPAASGAPERDHQATADPLVELGSRLQEARQARGLDRATLAGQLHMGVEQLEALETGDRHRLPELVFVIAQARRIASNLGLDAAPLVEPLRGLETSQRPPATGLPSPAQARSEPTTPAGRLKAPWPSGRRRTRRAGAAGPWPLQPLAGVALAVGLGAAGWWSLSRGAIPLSQPRPRPERAPDAPSPAAPAPTAAPKAAPSSAGAVLRLSSTEPSWLAVRRRDGTSLFEGNFQGERAFPLGQGLEVRAGRPDLVQASVAGGPSRRLGAIDQIRWWRFSPDGPATSAAPVPPP